MAKQFNRYAAGRKTYGAGRSNPTSGTVDPTGYIERSANNMASERRSGLASSAIRRRMSGPAATAGVGVTSNQQGGVLAGPWKRGGGLSGPQGAPSGGPSAGTGQNYTPPIPTAVGQMNEYQQQKEAVANWEPPTDFEAEARSAELEADRARMLLELGNQESSFKEAAGRRIRGLETQRPLALQGLADDFASRGMGYSGKHVTERGGLENQFAESITNTNEDLASRIKQIVEARSGGNANIQALLNQNAQAAAARQADDPRFRAPQITTANPFAPVGSGPEDINSLEAVKRRLAGPWKRF